MRVRHERLPSLDRFLGAYMAGSTGQPCHITGQHCNPPQRQIMLLLNKFTTNLHNVALCAVWLREGHTRCHQGPARHLPCSCTIRAYKSCNAPSWHMQCVQCKKRSLTDF